ncbi:hypothetical protein [Burkholderia sp. FERM BP-3421]|nr:hypothetical protein [Burkholderia sp. FERM BP-3421]
MKISLNEKYRANDRRTPCPDQGAWTLIGLDPARQKEQCGS